MGYIHRGIEKLCEDLTYPQTLHFMDRMDYFSAHNYHHALCMLYEKAAGIEISRRAQVIRVMMDELSRIASHCLFIGTYCMDLGATTMLFYTLRVREQILDIMEKTCGARMTFNYDCIGGVMQDLAPDFVEDVKALLAVIPANIKEYNKLFTGNIITKNRLKNVGVLSNADAKSWGVTGPSGRASGWACDMRKLRPYSIYSELDFEEVIAEEGDSMARFNVRMREIEESAKILEQLVAKTGLPPFLLGLNWSTTERMSAQQADILTSELWAIRRTVEPALEKICRTFLALEGLDNRITIEWDDISLQDITEEAKADLYMAQAEKYRAEAQGG